MPRCILLPLLLLLLPPSIYAQKKITACNENQDSPYKLFVFVGERLAMQRTIQQEDGDNKIIYTATYRILDRICGDYPVDTIRFEVYSFDDDSSLFRSSYSLLALTRDSGSTADEFSLSGQLHHDLFKDLSGEWVGAFDPNRDIPFETGHTALKPRRIAFNKAAFYLTKGMTREEIDLSYPAPYYHYRQDKAIPVLGNSLSEIWQYMKGGNLTSWGVYTAPPVKMRHRSKVVVQDVELEEIRQPDEDSMRQDLRVKIASDPFNEELIRRLVATCRTDSSTTECDLFFTKLIAAHPDSANAYVLKARYMHTPASPEDSSIIAVLQQAVRVDSLHPAANDMLVYASYQFFLHFPSANRANAARKYMMRWAAIDTIRLFSLKYPIIQLSHYLQDSATANRYENYTALRYFALETFFTPKKDWRHDYTIDMFRQTRRATYTVEWFSEELKYFNEPILHERTNQPVYRFLWLRSFHVPVVFCLRKKKNAVSISWKVALYDKQSAQYSSYTEKTKRLSLAAWNQFEKQLASIEFWSMIPGDYLSSVADGAIWMLEGAVNGRHHVVERQGSIYPKYTKCLLYLMSLTDLHLPNKQVY